MTIMIVPVIIAVIANGSGNGYGKRAGIDEGNGNA